MVKDAGKQDIAAFEEVTRTPPLTSKQQEEGRDEDASLEQLSREDLVERLREATDKADKYYDHYLRSQAEMENMKKRFSKDKEDWYKYANESLIKQILPAIDNLEKALTHTTEGGDVSKGLAEGISLTLKGLLDALEKVGVERIGAIGEPFDPHLHEAVSVQADQTCEPGSVLQEYQKGYLLNKRLLRPALVVVNKK